MVRAHQAVAQRGGDRRLEARLRGDDATCSQSRASLCCGDKPGGELAECGEERSGQYSIITCIQIVITVKH